MSGRVGLAVLLLLAACSGQPVKPPGNAAPSAVGGAAEPAPAATCPAAYAAPPADRPYVGLELALDAARRVVTGTERVTFTPDIPITELVFRLWPNSPAAPPGTVLAVTTARSGDQRAFTLEAAGGKPGTPGTLLRLPLGRTAPAGEAVTADVGFTLTLPRPAFDRWGSTGSTAWWGSGHPLLAWERGVGWQTAAAGTLPGEYSVAEVARYDVSVTAPAGDTVLVSGAAPAVARAAPVRTMNLLARDVSVAVGAFTQRSGMVDGVPIVAAVSAEVTASADTLLAEATHGLRTLTPLLGPYPYPTLTTVALPGLSSGGIEYPGGFFVGPTLNRRTITHETAHQWFYGLIGDDQSRDPWLDEAFATYAEAVANGKLTPDPRALARPAKVGSPMSAFGDRSREYVDTVYGKGGAVLLAARADEGPRAFDAALRCYLNANAWHVAVPADF
jgi:hypothetical protein